MKNTFHILIILAMLCASRANNATNNMVLNGDKFEVQKINHSCSTAGLAVQVLDNDAISPELRSRIQLVAFALSLPQIGISINDAVTTARNLRNQHPNDYDAVQEGLALRWEAARRDLEGFDEAWEFVRTHPRGAAAWEALSSLQIFRQNISKIQKMSDDISFEPNFFNWILNRQTLLNSWDVWNDTYRSLGDPVKDILGSGRINNSTEWNQIISEIQLNGGEVIFSPGRIAYSPGIRKGVPGQLIIDEDASISALRHEFRHFLDDYNAGFKGFEGIFDSNFRITTEFNGYKIEIMEMIARGETNAVNVLKSNFQEEVNDIIDKFGEPDQTVLQLINELLNL